MVGRWLAGHSDSIVILQVEAGSNRGWVRDGDEEKPERWSSPLDGWKLIFLAPRELYQLHSDLSSSKEDTIPSRCSPL